MKANNSSKARTLSARTHLNGLHMAIVLLVVLIFPCRTKAEDYLNNLANIFQDGPNPPGTSIGDCENLYPNGWYAVQFFTGGSSSNVLSFQLNWVTFELLGNHLLPFADVYVELYQQVGTDSILLGELGSPAIDPRRTEWPEGSSGECTTYVDYCPSKPMCLQTNSEYLVTLSTTTFRDDIWFPVLIFTLKTNYVTMGGWQLGSTTASNVFLDQNEEWLKFAIDVTPTPNPSSSGGISTNVPLSITRIGKQCLLSWPVSPFSLYSIPDLQSPAWTPFPLTPFRTNSELFLTVAPSYSSGYFQLGSP